MSVSFPLLSQNNQENLFKKRKGLFELTVSEISVLGHLVCCFEPVTGQDIIVRSTYRAELLSS